MVDLDGRVAVITGAGDGLGRSHARLLASLGARVVVNDLGGDRAGGGASSQASDRVVEEIRSAGGDAVANYGNVADEADVRALIGQAVDTYGRLDIVVNNAGILRDASFHKMSREDWDAVLKVHLQGSFLVTHAAWPVLREQRYGRVIFTTSGGGMFGNFGQSNYGTAKMGILGLMNCLAVEGSRRGILTNAVSPIANTRLTEDVMPEDQLETLDPGFVSPVVAWLASEDCKLTGEVIRAGGGAYSRVQYRVSRGVSLDHIPTVDEFTDHLERILDMQDATPGELAL